LPPILGDEERLGQVFSNLLDNAVKYTPENGTITISATAGEKFVEAGVADTGIGIPPQDLSRIFERFYRVDKARSRELGGTGLGLAIVKHLVEGHGGTVSVESPPGKGATFFVKLPTAPTPALQSKT
jgi:two-component system phosphate regulon sensor histidine kinase PhoR